MGQITVRSRAACWVVAIAVGLTLQSVGARADEPLLRWKFTQGEALRYQMDQKSITQLKGAEQDVKTTVTQTVDTTWAVRSVDSTGAAEISQSIDRIQTKIENNFAKFEYDSKSDKEPTGPIAGGMVPLMKALIGAKFHYKINPQGELSDIKVPESLVKVLKEAGPAGGSGGGMFSEEGLKNMIQEMSLMIPKDVEKGKSWTRQTKAPSPEIGTMVVDETYTYLGHEKEGDKITLEAKTTLEPLPNPPYDIKVGSQEGKGTFFFDGTAGRVVHSNVVEKIELVIKAMNREFHQSIDMTATMKLLSAGK